MDIHQLKYGFIQTLEIRRDPEEIFSFPRKGVEISLYYSETSSQTILKEGDQAFVISGVTPSDQQILSDINAQGMPKLCWLLHFYPKEKPTVCVIQVHQFCRLFRFPDKMEIGIDDQMVQQVQQKNPEAKTTEKVIDWLCDQLLLRPKNDIGRAFVSAGKGKEKSDPDAFRLHGISIAVDVKVVSESLQIQRIVSVKSTKNREEAETIMLTEAPITFCDATVAGKFRHQSRQQLEEIVATGESYMDLWSKYNDLEKAGLLEKARMFGYFRYESWNLEDGYYQFRLQEKEKIRECLQALSMEEECQMEASAEIPEELLLHPVSEANNLVEKKMPVNSQRVSQNPFMGERIIKVDSQRLTITVAPIEREDEEISPPQSGYLYPCLRGDDKRINRRKKASLSISNAICPMPQLGLILEGKPVPTAHYREIEPFSPKLKKKFQDHPLTFKQKEAIRIALNTPDIALIQGPPGTGKTTVITALMTRLAELANSQESISGLILLTSYQHDAVENAAERTEIYGIPAKKFGQKRKNQNFDDNQSTYNWAKERIDKVRLCLPQLPENVRYKQMEALVQAYSLKQENASQTAKLLKKIYDLSDNLVPGELRDKLRQEQIKLEYMLDGSSPDEQTDRELIIKSVRGIRTEPVSFGDDGSIKARKALIRLTTLDILQTNEVNLLQKAADWVEKETPPFLKELEKLQERLLENITVVQHTQTESFSNVDIQKLLMEVLESAAGKIARTQDATGNVLSEYLQDLENDPYGIEDTLNQYRAVFAATCQQVQSEYIPEGESRAYDAVLVDEAARANPLDLFIPMSKAKRRIVLVGDHRQLPHMLEPTLEKELETSLSERAQKALRESLFQRLFKQLREQEQRDGIQRTITLDVQYRMPKILGNFISEQFYEIPDETGSVKIDTGVDDKDCQHNLPEYIGKVAIWIDVPYSQGAEESRGNSKARRAEARRIAEEVKNLMEQNKYLSFGIITFYTAQKEAIQEELRRMDIMERTDEGEYVVLPKWKSSQNSSGSKGERLRVGTVDAFQGREFDVVLLSMTRSNPYYDKTEKERRKKYGHLMLMNRLCVAMSRQKRLLIVVGDARMLKSPAAKDVIKPLVAFHELCEGTYGCCI